MIKYKVTKLQRETCNNTTTKWIQPILVCIR